MRPLLDESFPRKLKTRLAPPEVWTVPEMGRASKSNGEFRRLAEQEFEVFLTADQKTTPPAKPGDVSYRRLGFRRYRQSAARH
jgi:hypothetical protein